ncbi:chitosanase [Nonomuraea sp. NPDC050556]|uniref:chitosanase n=1 Tax=Nonomuraea sp. NPDC050556 TaxID=3364369 RepID=UPI0037BC7CA6
MSTSPAIRRALAAAVAAVSVPAVLLVAPGAFASADVLLSQGKSVTTSSTEGSGFEASKAVDGNTTTRWSSAEGVDPQWIRVDLGASATVSRINLKWEAAYGKAYKIQTSADGSSWTDVYSTTSGDGGTDDLAVSGSGRYIRLYGTARGTAYGYSLYEFQVYGSSGGSTPSPTPTSTPTPTPTVSPTSQPGGVISQGKPATASSTEGSGFEAGKAVDGSTTTRWSSAEGVDPQWIRVDLGSSATISRVKLSWEAAYGKAYKIQTSADGSSWTDVYSTTSGDGGTDDLTVSGSGRYVRLYGTARGTAYGYSLYEFQVYGAGGSTPSPSPTPTTTPTSGVDLNDPAKKEIAMQIVSSAENSSLNWKAQYKYIEDIGDGRGYTAGIIGFCSGTGDMLDMVELYTQRVPGNVLAKYLPALRSVNGTDSHAGLGSAFEADWARADSDPAFRKAQDDERDRVYFNPAVSRAKSDGVRTLGQFMYYDAIVMHGDGGDPESFSSIRANALKKAKPPAQGGNETTWLNAFLDARRTAMLAEEAHSDTSRVDTAQRVFLNNGNFNLNTPLDWAVYGEPYHIS